MKPGPKPLGNKAMTAAERQARFRATHTTGGLGSNTEAPPTAAAGRRDGMRRWPNSSPLQDDYGTWLNALPPNLEASATAEALRAICDLDLSDLESVEPPRGFGRD